MQPDLLTVGQFAALAETTKRTVLWYEEKAILKPKAINPENGYRLYGTGQVIDFKAILLLRKLNFSIAEIRSWLARDNLTETLFNLKKQVLKREIADLQTALSDTEKYYQNLKKTGTLVDPRVKTIGPLSVHYIEKEGPYYKIGDYFEHMRRYFEDIPESTSGLVIYEDIGYKPERAKVKICFVERPGLKLKTEAERVVRKMAVRRFKALSYTHVGSSKLLSLLWQEMRKYRDKNNYKEDKSLPFEDLELSQSARVTEMLMPII